MMTKGRASVDAGGFVMEDLHHNAASTTSDASASLLREESSIQPNGNDYRAGLAARLRGILGGHSASPQASPWARRILGYPEPNMNLRETAWLDGMRGLAAFQVFIFHYLDGWTDKELSYGTGPRCDPAGWWRIPFVRTLYSSGNAAVCLFFCISGYVLSYRVLGLIRARKLDEAVTSLSSAVFRRAFRLYTPIVMETFALLFLCNAFGLPKARAFIPADNWFLEIIRTIRRLTMLGMPLRYPDRWLQLQNDYDGGVSWTIPLEYYGSLVVYITLLATIRIQRFALRTAIIACIFAQALIQDEWYACQFLMGVVLAEYSLVEKEKRQETGKSIDEAEAEDPRPWRIAKWVMFAFGFYLAGLPPGRMTSDNVTVHPRPFFEWFVWWASPLQLYAGRQWDRNFYNFAANLLLFSGGRLLQVRNFLCTRPVQYLGRISFGLYLCHIFIRPWLLPILPGIITVVGLDSTLHVDQLPKGIQLFTAYLVWMGLSTVINFAVAGLFERQFDQRSIRFARDVEQFCLDLNSGKRSLLRKSADPQVPFTNGH
ncbi:hypothetical protein PYCC9005_004025 [Savitreella phatthalungensis]